jgi:hypothetical protein
LGSRLGAGVQAYRRLGPVRGTAEVVRRGVEAGRGAARAVIVPRRPIAVSPADVAAALGGLAASAALARAGAALPTVERWARTLDSLEAAERESLLDRADRALAHEFDLLGSGPLHLGPVIDWHRDFKSGRRWPLRHISRIVVSYPDASDIKVPWELSRAQHLPVLAAAWRVTGDRRYLDELGDQLVAWIEANPVEMGVNWQCAMDVAIRAANWVAALVLAAGAPPAGTAWLPAVTASLLLHARFIRGHLEDGPARGNHYLADVVGLLVVAAVFQDSAEGRDWIDWSVGQLARELAHQVRPDGCDHESSTSYHRLVTEMFIVGADAADALAPGRLDPAVRPAVGRMLAFVADYTRPDGLAPQIGDADDGRFLPLGGYRAADQRSHLHLFAQAGAAGPAPSAGPAPPAASPPAPSRRSAAYPAGGWYVMRGGDLYAAVRCGDVGIHGRGCHAHNDLLAFELSWRDVPLVVDPGSYLYTADPTARDAFRSVTAHSALQVDDLEQNAIRPDRLFAMADRAQPEVVAWEPGESVTTLTGRHHGFTTPAERCVHTRTLRLDGGAGVLEVLDAVTAERAHRLTWRFPLAPCQVTVADGVARARFGGGVTLEIAGDGLSAEVQDGWLSPSYGVRCPAPVAVLRGASEPGEHRARVVLRVLPESADP